MRYGNTLTVPEFLNVTDPTPPLSILRMVWYVVWCRAVLSWYEDVRKSSKLWDCGRYGRETQSSRGVRYVSTCRLRRATVLSMAYRDDSLAGLKPKLMI